MTRIRVGAVGDVPVGTGRVVETPGPTVALFNAGGTFYATDNACAHRGGPLGEGRLQGTIVTCPWHGWRWEVTTGANVNNPAVAVPCFPVTVEDGQLFIEIP